MKDQRVGPGGSAPNPPTPPHPAVRPEDWVESADGMGTSTTQGPASQRCGECACVSERSSGSIKGVRRESRAPINKKHGSGIVFPPHSTHPSLSGCAVWPVGSLIGDAAVPHDLRDPELKPAPALNGPQQVWFSFRPRCLWLWATIVTSGFSPCMCVRVC